MNHWRNAKIGALLNVRWTFPKRNLEYSFKSVSIPSPPFHGLLPSLTRLSSLPSPLPPTYLCPPRPHLPLSTPPPSPTYNHDKYVSLVRTVTFLHFSLSLSFKFALIFHDYHPMDSINDIFLPNVEKRFNFFHYLNQQREMKN